MLKSGLCDYSDAYILLKETVTIVGGGADNLGRVTGRNYKQTILKNYTI